MTEEEAEARTIKYNIARIVKLSTGRFALFDPWSNQDGIPLIAIGSLDYIADLIPTAEECEQAYTENTPADSGPDLLGTLGLIKPKAPITRRI